MLLHKGSQNHHVNSLLVIVIIAVNVFQSIYTELTHDEAYYWVYAQHMDWGYFDHPPMIAVLIKLGSLILPGELGVRVLIVLMNLGTTLILYELIGRQNFRILLAVLTGVTVFHIYGFIAVPDSPLLFFTALFFLTYKRFIDKENLMNSLLLSLVIAALLFSKYHGILIVLATVISNFKIV